MSKLQVIFRVTVDETLTPTEVSATGSVTNDAGWVKAFEKNYALNSDQATALMQGLEFATPDLTAALGE